MDISWELLILLTMIFSFPFVVGGKQSVRSYWENFVSNTDVLVFVVDSADVGRFPEAKEELHKLLRDDRLKNVPLILVANKQVCLLTHQFHV